MNYVDFFNRKVAIEVAMKRSAVKAAITMMAIGLGALTSSCVESAGSYQPSFFSYPNYDRDGEVGHWNVDNWNDIDVRP